MLDKIINITTSSAFIATSLAGANYVPRYTDKLVKLQVQKREQLVKRRLSLTNIPQFFIASLAQKSLKHLK